MRPAHPVRVPAIVKGAELTVFSRRPARRAAPEGRAPSRRRSALARVTARAVVPVAAVGGLAGLSLAAPAVTTAAPAAAHLTSARAVPAIGHPILTKARVAPISTSDCLAMFGIPCYSPLQFRTAYDLNPLYARGITGEGSDDHDRRLVRIPDASARSRHVRLPVGPAENDGADRPGRHDSAVRPERRADGDLGRRGQPRRAVRARDCAGRAHRARRDRRSPRSKDSPASRR